MASAPSSSSRKRTRKMKPRNLRLENRAWGWGDDASGPVAAGEKEGLEIMGPHVSNQKKPFGDV
jgi:hypothetical protein